MATRPSVPVPISDRRWARTPPPRTKKHTIYVINTTDNGKSYWNRAGVAFGNRDGSFTFKLDIFPQTKFQLREEQPATKAEAAE